jgi:hypothetical protein
MPQLSGSDNSSSPHTSNKSLAEFDMLIADQKISIAQSNYALIPDKAMAFPWTYRLPLTMTNSWLTKEMPQLNTTVQSSLTRAIAF